MPPKAGKKRTRLMLVPNVPVPVGSLSLLTDLISHSEASANTFKSLQESSGLQDSVIAALQRADVDLRQFRDHVDAIGKEVSCRGIQPLFGAHTMNVGSTSSAGVKCFITRAFADLLDLCNGKPIAESRVLVWNWKYLWLVVSLGLQRRGHPYPETFSPVMKTHWMADACRSVAPAVCQADPSLDSDKVCDHIRWVLRSFIETWARREGIRSPKVKGGKRGRDESTSAAGTPTATSGPPPASAPPTTPEQANPGPSTPIPTSSHQPDSTSPATPADKSGLRTRNATPAVGRVLRFE